MGSSGCLAARGGCRGNIVARPFSLTGCVHLMLMIIPPPHPPSHHRPTHPNPIHHPHPPTIPPAQPSTHHPTHPAIHPPSPGCWFGALGCWSGDPGYWSGAGGCCSADVDCWLTYCAWCCANYANPLPISRAIFGTQSKVQNSTSQLFLESPAWVG